MEATVRRTPHNGSQRFSPMRAEGLWKTGAADPSAVPGRPLGVVGREPLLLPGREVVPGRYDDGVCGLGVE